MASLESGTRHRLVGKSWERPHTAPGGRPSFQERLPFLSFFLVFPAYRKFPPMTLLCFCNETLENVQRKQWVMNHPQRWDLGPPQADAQLWRNFSLRMLGDRASPVPGLPGVSPTPTPRGCACVLKASPSEPSPRCFPLDTHARKKRVKPNDPPFCKERSCSFLPYKVTGAREVTEGQVIDSNGPVLPVRLRRNVNLHAEGWPGERHVLSAACVSTSITPFSPTLPLG